MAISVDPLDSAQSSMVETMLYRPSILRVTSHMTAQMLPSPLAQNLNGWRSLPLMNTVEGGRWLDRMYPTSRMPSFSIMYPTARGPTSPAPTKPAKTVGFLMSGPPPPSGPISKTSASGNLPAMRRRKIRLYLPYRRGPAGAGRPPARPCPVAEYRAGRPPAPAPLRSTRAGRPPAPGPVAEYQRRPPPLRSTAPAAAVAEYRAGPRPRRAPRRRGGGACAGAGEGRG